ncbi:hypothetical protein [Alkalimarinus alittae]|uniref:Uncharacterized protein n=1 Tax=Alkalimarinus alittae TaxID=2961619 RepID=A0ABY6N4B5_9ALTE|nr:hypothetical protein [Alkalimarinus alittae]UZE96931.1 hypothetical protein NKI27_04045 [Alkalimarinus alittae]
MFFTQDVLGNKIMVNNLICWGLIEVFKAQYPNDPAYVNEKIEKIRDLPTFESILEWFNLDHGNKAALANKINMPFDLLDRTAQGCKWIYNH